MSSPSSPFLSRISNFLPSFISSNLSTNYSPIPLNPISDQSHQNSNHFLPTTNGRLPRWANSASRTSFGRNRPSLFGIPIPRTRLLFCHILLVVFFFQGIVLIWATFWKDRGGSVSGGVRYGYGYGGGGSGDSEGVKGGGGGKEMGGISAAMKEVDFEEVGWDDVVGLGTGGKGNEGGNGDGGIWNEGDGDGWERLRELLRVSHPSRPLPPIPQPPLQFHLQNEHWLVLAPFTSLGYPFIRRAVTGTFRSTLSSSSPDDLPYLTLLDPITFANVADFDSATKQAAEELRGMLFDDGSAATSWSSERITVDIGRRDETTQTAIERILGGNVAGREGLPRVTGILCLECMSSPTSTFNDVGESSVDTDSVLRAIKNAGSRLDLHGDSQTASMSVGRKLPWLVMVTPSFLTNEVLDEQNNRPIESKLQSISDLLALPPASAPFHAIHFRLPNQAAVLPDGYSSSSPTASSRPKPKANLASKARTLAHHFSDFNHFLLSTLGHLPIHLDSFDARDSNKATTSIIDTRDVANAVFGAIRVLSQARTATVGQENDGIAASLPNFVASLDIFTPVSSSNLTQSELIYHLLEVTQSKSPIGWLAAGRRRDELTLKSDGVSDAWSDGFRGHKASGTGDSGPLAWWKQVKDRVGSVVGISPSQSIVEIDPDAFRARASTLRILGTLPGTQWEKTVRGHVESMLSAQEKWLFEEVNRMAQDDIEIENSAQGKINPNHRPSAMRQNDDKRAIESGLLALGEGKMQLLTTGDDGKFYALACEGDEGGPQRLRITRGMQYLGGVRMLGARFRWQSSGAGDDNLEMQIYCNSDMQDNVGIVYGGVSAAEEAQTTIKPDTVMGWLEGREDLEMQGIPEMHHPEGETWRDWLRVDIADTHARTFELLSENEATFAKWAMKWGEDGKAVFGTKGDAIKWRINPVCTTSSVSGQDFSGGEHAWDAWKDDPLTISQIYYPSSTGKNSLQQTTLNAHRMSRLKSQLDRIGSIRKDLLGSEDSFWWSTLIGGEKKGHSKPLSYSKMYDKWSEKDVELCMVDSTAPIACFPTKSCRCPIYSHIGQPLPDANAPTTKTQSQLSLFERVDRLSLASLLMPGARRAYNLALDQLPKAHVVPVDDSVDKHYRDEKCYDIGAGARLPTLNDHYLVQTLANASVPVEHANFAIVPYYQGCYANHVTDVDKFANLDETIKFARRYLGEASFVPGKMLVPFSHDFGECTGWAPTLEESNEWGRPFPMNEAISWQGNGDMYTPCVKPGRDIIIPGTPKHVSELIEDYGDIRRVRPFIERRHLAFFHGGVRGFGNLVRTRLGCGIDDREEVVYQDYEKGGDYLSTLKNSKFCLLPRGIPAWTTRTYEVIYSGCIPVFVAERNLPPLYDIFDYSTFSISLRETSLDTWISQLRAYAQDGELMMEMQAALLKVRESFVFRMGMEMERMGPIRMTLVELSMRLGLVWPTD